MAFHSFHIATVIFLVLIIILIIALHNLHIAPVIFLVRIIILIIAYTLPQ
jgi:hypothetical protein